MILLGEVTCPSGQLILMDGGYLGLWSGDRTPLDLDAQWVDAEIVGPEAASAAEAFHRETATALYDIPRHASDKYAGLFASLAGGYDASLRILDAQVPHRERARRAIAAGEPGFSITGVPVVAVGGLPTDRPLPVYGVPADDYGWACLRIEVSDAPVAATREMGAIGVDAARFAFADADALAAWRHEEPVDGLADVVFWGRDEDAVAAELGATRTGTAGDDVYGWLDLPLDEAAVRADDLAAARGPRMFAYDVRPHSDHWRVMAGVRASAHEAATVEVGGASVMFAMTSVGDGFFPVRAELDAHGALRAIVVTVEAEN